MLLEALIGTAVVLIVLGVIVYLWRSEPERVARRALLRSPVEIAAAAVGKPQTFRGKAHARAHGGQTLDDASCLYVRTSVLHFFRKKGTDGQRSEAWKSVAEEQQGGPFDLVDGSGRVVVDPSGAFCLVSERWTDIDWDQLSERQAALLGRHSGAVAEGHPAKVREQVVTAGETLSVFGELQQAGAAEGVLAAADGKVLAIGQEVLGPSRWPIQRA